MNHVPVVVVDCLHVKPLLAPASSLQLVWLVRELVKSGIMGADGVVMTLLKQIAGETLAHSDSCRCWEEPSCDDDLFVRWRPGGDISSKNLWLAESVLDILLEQKYVSPCPTVNAPNG